VHLHSFFVYVILLFWAFARGCMLAKLA